MYPSKIIIVIIIITLYKIFTPVVTGGFQWNLNNSKSSQLFRTLFSILTKLNSVVIWMVSILLQISSSPSPSFMIFRTILRALKLASLSPSCFITFSALWQGPGISLDFCFPLLLLCDLMKWQSLLSTSSFPFF